MPLQALALLALLLGLPLSALAEEAPLVQVYKSATCGCCSDWIDHLEANGFRAEAHDVGDLGALKRILGVRPELASCHTAKVGGYVIEGHVPAREIHRLLREQPPLMGLAVPRMPIGSPGMEGPNPEPYQVLAFDAKGRTEVFAVYAPDGAPPSRARPADTDP